MQPSSTGLNQARAQGEHPNFAGALLDCLAHGVILVGSARQVLGCNETAERLAGVHAADLVNRPSSVLPPALQSVIDETFVTGSAVAHRNVLLTREAGTDVLLQVSTTVSHQAGGGVLAVLAELQDIGQARGIAANLEHLDRLASVGVLGASVAHEIKNALVPIRTFVELPEADRSDRELTDLVGQEIRRIDTVVRQMLRGATREEFKLAPLHLHAVLRDSVNLLRHQCQARGVKLDAQFSAASDRINGDERQLRHAVINLLINAIESMGENGRLTVSTEAVDLWSRPHLRVTFRDTGSGISPDNLARLFSPFFTTKRDGTGLGLAITRRIIQEHNGAITVESVVGQGTVFHVFLPLLAQA